MCGDSHVAVIQRHANNEKILGQWSSSKCSEGLFGECAIDLHYAVATEVEDDNGVVVMHGSDRNTCLVHHREGGQVLVAHACVFGPKCGQGSCGRREWSSCSLSMGLPAIFNNGPISLVAVHGDDHATAARAHDRGAAMGGGSVSQECLEVGEICLGSAVDDITTIK